MENEGFCEQCSHCQLKQRLALRRGGIGLILNEIDRIIVIVADSYHISPVTLQSRLRTSHVAMARMIAMYLMRRLTSLSYPNIGIALKRDHSTVMHAYGLIDRRMRARPLFAKEIERLVELFEAQAHDGRMVA
jgi:chromosomal replication initiation ATPase DnaA